MKTIGNVCEVFVLIDKIPESYFTLQLLPFRYCSLPQ